MSEPAVRPAFSTWPDYNRSLVEVVGALTEPQLAVQPTPERWPLPMLAEMLRRPEWNDSRTRTRGSVLQRVFAHDVYHRAELNETLSRIGLPMVDFWA